ncbi:exopolyphosphatase [Arcobacteraceae bacterium]|nr:exopolyphosphatase [Arcobacteraceae bacterium]
MSNHNLQDIVTSIDLGSNSFRVLKFDCKLKKSLAEFDITVGTADGLSQTGNISKEALQRIIHAIKTSIEIVDYDPKSAIAVTTQALRIANNSQEILDEIKKQTGIDFKIIDGKQEGELSLLSIQNALKRENLQDTDFVLIDIGGGSSELVIYQNGTSYIKSFAFGIVTLSQSSNQERDFKIFENDITTFLNTNNYDLSKSLFISVAGTPSIIAALKNGLDNKDYDKEVVNGTTLTSQEVVDIQDKLNSLSKDELIQKVGTGREDFINTGMLIYRLFFKTLKKETSIVFDDGLREGVALNACKCM